MLRGRPFARRHGSQLVSGTAPPAGFGLRGIFLSSPPLIYLDSSRPGTITQAAGVVSAWADPDTALSATAAGAAQPAYAASDANFNNQPSLTGDGVDDVMAFTLDRPAPLTQPTFILAVIRVISHTSGDSFWGAGSNTMSCNQLAASPNVAIRNPTAGTTNTDLPVGATRAIAALYDGGLTSYLRVGSNAKATGVDVGNTDPAATFSIFARTTNSWANISLSLFCMCAGDPTGPEYTAALAYCNTTFGTPT